MSETEDTETEVKQRERGGTVIARWKEDCGAYGSKQHRLGLAGAGEEFAILHQKRVNDSKPWRTVDTWDASERPEVLPGHE